MDGTETIWRADWLHDGIRLRRGAALWLRGDRVAGVVPAGAALPSGARVVDLGEGGIAPGMVDLQVNGGGGAMVGATRDAGDLAAICAAHARLGATAILPTLITATHEVTARVIAAGIAAARAGVPGFAGLHLEGPHLDPRRAGAHDPALIRPMTEADLALYVAAAAELPVLMVTLAPEAATPAQIAALAGAGVVVSLGHSDCPAEDAHAAFAAGARAVTHLFNAMSGLGHRAPGLVGAALAGQVPAGLIADGVHVAGDALRVALAAHPGLFLVSDAMAVAGTAMTGFDLDGRRIERREGRLELADGTLAGADLDLPGAVAHLVGLGCGLEGALAMATSRPAALIGASAGLLVRGARADFLHLGPDLGLRRVWRGGAHVEG